MRLINGGLLGIVAVIAAACWPANAQSPVLELRPVDEALSDASLVEFRRALIGALRAGDVDHVLGGMTPQLMGSRQGHWRAIPRRDLGSSGAWVEFQRLLAMGGSFTTTRGAVLGRREFCAPYVYSAFPERPLPDSIAGEVDPWVILGEKVPVYAERHTRSKVLLHLSHAIVRTGGGLLGPGQDGTFWAPLHLPDDREGFVIAEQIRSPSDYHACFAKIDGAWRITAFARNVNPR